MSNFFEFGLRVLCEIKYHIGAYSLPFNGWSLCHPATDLESTKQTNKSATLREETQLISEVATLRELTSHHSPSLPEAIDLESTLQTNKSATLLDVTSQTRTSATLLELTSFTNAIIITHQSAIVHILYIWTKKHYFNTMKK
ncbi:hypothetical protein GLP20_00510 [Photobacterium carnosum]|nr:hypothetical protein [Photobacterium carnosum]MCD9493375.1 hypothetical protein [Photobacterium carnosum]